jgi:nicotinate-nucleotide adenylyltransferase
LEDNKPVQHIRRVGLMGGTFDPIHYGHLVVAEEVRFTLDLAEMVFLPAGQPPHKAGATVTTAHHRLTMLELALASNPHFSISTIDIERPGPSYTVDTLQLVREQWGERTGIYFVIGWDSLEYFLTWHDPAGILAQLAFLVAVRRPGYEDEPGTLERIEQRLPGIRQRLLVVPAPRLEISATDLRQRVATGRPITYQLPEKVEQYITDHRLYR